jgi:hypothetical protein
MIPNNSNFLHAMQHQQPHQQYFQTPFDLQLKTHQHQQQPLANNVTNLHPTQQSAQPLSVVSNKLHVSRLQLAKESYYPLSSIFYIEKKLIFIQN